MKLKLIVSAVSGTLVVPAAMAQDPELKLYGRITQALEYVNSDDPESDDQADIANINSRIGVKASTDLGNGLTVRGHYEFSTFTDIEGERNAANIAADGGSVKTRGGIDDTRIATAGIAGNFGAIDVGNQWSSFFNTAGTYMDPTFTVSYNIYSSITALPYRSSNTIKYSNSFGPVYVETDFRVSDDTEPPQDVEELGRDNGEDFLDGWGLGVSWGVTEALTLAAAWDQEIVDIGDNADRLAISGQFRFGAHSIGGGWGAFSQDLDAGVDDDRDAFSAHYVGNFAFGTVLVGAAVASVDATGVDPNQVFWGYYRDIGGGFQIWYEGTTVDFDEETDDPNFDRNLIGIQYDF